jgi:hypothetical protein
LAETFPLVLDGIVRYVLYFLLSALSGPHNRFSVEINQGGTAFRMSFCLLIWPQI